jgi:cytochrome b559 alpha subunit
MPKILLVLLLFFLVAYVVVASGLEYETFGEPRPDEYFTPEVTESND